MPKTAEQEKLEGYPGHRRLSKSAPELDLNIPPPPEWMGNISTRAYHDLVRAVGPEGMRVMARSDKMALVAVCEAFEEWRLCRRILDKEGRYFESGKVLVNDQGVVMAISNRQIKRHPAVNDMKDWWKHFLVGLGKFGLTPYDRQKVSAIADPKSKEKTRDEVRAEQRQKALKVAKSKQHVKVVNG